MSEENKTVELKEDDLSKIAGGKLIPCDSCFSPVIPDGNGLYICKVCGYSTK